VSIDLQKYSTELRVMVEDYYHNRINFNEYRQLRNELFSEIDKGLNIKATDEKDDKCNDGKMLYRILNFLKKDENEIISE